jgi:NADH-quinone oxidoreductase subunit B
MSEPRWVIAVGACASSGGIFDTSTLQGIDKVIPVDVYLSRPEQIVDGVMKLQKLVRTENVRRRSSPARNYCIK